MSGVNPNIKKAKTISSEFYYSKTKFEESKEQLFAKNWQLIGDVNQIKNHGDVLPYEFIEGFIQDPRDAFAQASVLVLPTRYDPASNVLLEAMASGVVPIGSSQDGMTEILPERWMILSPKDSAKHYALAIEKAYTASGLSEQCRSIAENFSPQKTFESLLSLGTQ